MTKHIKQTLISTRACRPLLVGLTTALLAAGCGGGGSDVPGDPTGQSADVTAMPDAVALEVEPGSEFNRTEALRFRRPSPTPVPAPAPVPTAEATTATTATCGLPNFQASALARINQYRATGASCRTRGQFAPAPSVVVNSKLLQAATGHSQDMATRNYFSHTSPDGRTMADRINATGYVWSTIGENIAAGYPTVNAVIDGWMTSDGHCANLMNPNFKDAALACVASSTSTYRTYWTLDLGKQR